MGSGEGEMRCGRVAHVVDSMRAAVLGGLLFG